MNWNDAVPLGCSHGSAGGVLPTSTSTTSLFPSEGVGRCVGEEFPARDGEQGAVRCWWQRGGVGGTCWALFPTVLCPGGISSFCL